MPQCRRQRPLVGYRKRQSWFTMLAEVCDAASVTALRDLQRRRASSGMSPYVGCPMGKEGMEVIPEVYVPEVDRDAQTTQHERTVLDHQPRFDRLTPITPHYATLPVLEGFNWSGCLAGVEDGRW